MCRCQQQSAMLGATARAAICLMRLDCLRRLFGRMTGLALPREHLLSSGHRQAGEESAKCTLAKHFVRRIKARCFASVQLQHPARVLWGAKGRCTLISTFHFYFHPHPRMDAALKKMFAL